ncbi:ion channel [Methylobacterium sp. 092160098-2]|uniref:ion channel n=1 Tax=Methylobacterium sp. 092160098-2 TaxID=3025129 RepID=UPI002381BF21|nr:ion channel [Methylobacterium sp. 092160098-2]MDE4910855.1 ion channel [Methylobacterium sp. 092160098-2]
MMNDQRRSKFGMYLLYICIALLISVSIFGLFFVDPKPSNLIYIGFSIAVLLFLSNTFSAVFAIYRRKDLIDRGRVLIVSIVGFSIAMIVIYAIIYRHIGLKLPDTKETIPSPSDSLYFSIVTWTTLGYGDIVPLAETRLVAASEALIGYLVMAFLIASALKFLELPARAEKEADKPAISASPGTQGHQRPEPHSAPPPADP